MTILPVDSMGAVNPVKVEKAIRPQTILVTVMHANNEVGTIQPISEITKIAQEHGIIVHTDAAQSVGKIPSDVQKLGVDLLSIAGHKIYAPKGIGALYVRRGFRFRPFILGGHQERGRRAGTHNVPGIIALGKAAELAAAHLVDAISYFVEAGNLVQVALAFG